MDPDDNNDCRNEDLMSAMDQVKESTGQAADDVPFGEPLSELCHQREERTFAAMSALNPTVARQILPQRDEDVQTHAAIVIQSYYRGYLARCKFVELLYDQYEKEEEERKKQTEQQVEEGELLVQNYSLEVAIKDGETAYKNKERLYESRIITIQRAWRAYKRRKVKLENEILPCANERIADESDEHPINDKEDESTEERSDQLRKKTLLSLAQEFVDLKEQFNEVLPYNAHKATLLSDSSLDSSGNSSMAQTPSLEGLSGLTLQESSSTNNTENSRISSGGFATPQLDLGGVDKVPSTQSEAPKPKSVKDLHREDVRKRLAMNTPGEGAYGDMYARPPVKSYRGGNAAGLELFVNECNDEVTPSPGDMPTDLDLSVKQQKLQEEASIAYIQAGPIAKRMIEVEKRSQQPSAVASMLGVSSFRSKGENALSTRRLNSLTLPQLQVVFNGMRNEIERLNEELVQCVVSRDELHMQQDSLLVNIDDLQRRADELAKRHQAKILKKEARRAENQDQHEKKRGGRLSRFFNLGAS